MDMRSGLVHKETAQFLADITKILPRTKKTLYIPAKAHQGPSDWHGVSPEHHEKGFGHEIEGWGQKRLITQILKLKRLKKVPEPSNMIKKKKVIILFLDKKIFDIDSIRNFCLNIYNQSSGKTWEVTDHIKFNNQSTHPTSGLVFSHIRPDCKKMQPHYFLEGTIIKSRADI